MFSIRRALELFARGRIMKRYLLVHGRREPIIVSPDAQLKYADFRAGSFDADLVRIAEVLVQRDWTVWDIGANVGSFSVAAACSSKGGFVLAVEADPWLAELLRRTVEASPAGKRNIHVLCVAASDRDGTDELMVAGRGRASNALRSAGGRSQMGGIRETRLVPTLKLDTVAIDTPVPRFLKIDVEGGEEAVIRGSMELISRHLPIIYIEMEASQFDVVSNSLAPLGYESYDSYGRKTKETDAGNYFLIHRYDQEAKDLLERLYISA